MCSVGAMYCVMFFVYGLYLSLGVCDSVFDVVWFVFFKQKTAYEI